MAVTNLGSGGSALDAQSGSTSGADTNDPLWLAHDGTNYVYLPGVAGNYLSVPDEAALDIVGDIDIRVKVAPDDWTPAALQYLVGKFDTGQKSYALLLMTDGKFRLYWSSDGSAETFAASTVTPSVADGATLWVRVTLDVDNGASGHDVKFYTSDDGVTWTQLGSTVTTGGTTSIYAGTSALNVGADAAGTGSLAAGKVYRAQVIADPFGTPTTVLDIDTSVITSGSATSFQSVDSSPKTVTINRSTSGRKAVAVTAPVWLLGTDDYFEVADNALLDFGASDSFTVLAVVRQWATPASYAALVSKMDGSGIGYAIDNADTAFQVYAALKGSSGSALYVSLPGSYTAGESVLLCLTRDTAADTVTLRQNAVVASVTDDTTGSLANTSSLFIGTRAGGFTDIELLAVAVFRRVLTDAEIALVTSYYQSRWP